MTRSPDEQIATLQEKLRQQEARLRELEESEGRLRAFLESASQGVVAIDPAGKLLLVNAKTEQMFGYSRQELLGAPLEMLLPETLRHLHAKHRQDYFGAPRSRPMGVGMELRGRKKDGSEFPVEISLSFVRESSRQLAVALITDISARKEIETQMQQRQKLESLGVLAGGIAHDFNNLLTGIIGNASLVLGEMGPDHPLYRHVRDVIEAGQQAATLTRQLLAYAGKGQFYIREVDIAPLVREVVGMVRSSVPGSVRIAVDLPEHLPPVSADSGQLQQLFLNMILNAAEAIDGRRGTVWISARTIDSNALPASRLSANGLLPGRYLSVEVKDDGCGMDEATSLRIFDPFFTTKFTGRGLGLAAARGIVEAHHGSIEVTSAPGKGSTFTVLLPAAPPGKHRDTEPEDLSGSGVVLVVDDEEVVRRTAAAALRRYGYLVLSASDGPSAIDIVRESGSRLCAVLLDLAMPGMDGVETLDHIKAIAPEVPVLLSSGFGEIEATHRLAGAELAGFLQKPYTAAQLAREVRRVCKKASQHAESGALP